MGAVCEHDGSFGLVLQSTGGAVLDEGPLSEGALGVGCGCDVVVQGGAEPSGHAVGQFPFASGVEPLSQLDCPGPLPIPGDGVGCVEGAGIVMPGASV